MNFDHLTIRTLDLLKTKDFFEKVFGVVEGERPTIIQKIKGYWLYDQMARPVIHLIEAQGGDESYPSEAIDHVGIRPNETYNAFKDRLDRLHVPYSLMDITELNERRIFFRTPGRTLLEAVFDNSTASAIGSGTRIT